MTVVLAAHGSPDPRHAAVVEEIRVAVAAELGETVVGWLGHEQPSLAQAVGRHPRPTVVVPLLLSPAFHATVDIPSEAGDVPVAPVLAPDVRLLEALDDRTAEALVAAARTVVPDGLVLAAAGSTDPAGDRLVRQVATAWSERNQLPVEIAYATSTPDLTTAVGRLWATGARTIAVGSFFLAPGRLHGAIEATAQGLGVGAVARPLGAHPALVQVVIDRARQVVPAVPG